MMQHITLNSGHQMPIIGLGTWLLRNLTDGNDDVVNRTVQSALQAGYHMIDTASVYKNESDIGRSLKDLPQFNLKRSDIFITSKLDPKDQGYDSAYNACLQSIKKLACDYLDLYLIHWPATTGLQHDDPKNKENRKQSWKALEKLQAEGHVRSIGVSNYLIRHLEEMDSYCNIVPAVNQIEFHPYLYQKDLLDYCKSKNIFLQAFTSVGRGKFLGDDVFVKLGEKYEKTSAQILLRWAIEHDAAILPKSTNAEHLRENLEVLNFSMEPEDVRMMDNLNKDLHICWNPGGVV